LEEEEEEDIGDQLARQLRIYKQFKTVAEMLRQRETDGLKNFIRVASPPKLEPKLTLGDVTLDDLVAAVRQALEVRPPDPAVSEVVSPMAVTIGEQMALIRAELTQGSQIRFQDLLGRAVSRVEIIVTFLAVLELIKQYVIEVQQDGLFGDIVISPRKTEPQPRRPNDDSEETGGEENGSITGQALSQE
jgi:segregation and condensation protein A